MANHKSAKKRIRQIATRRLRNRYNAKTTRNAMRDLRNIDDADAAKAAFPKVISMLDKLAKRRVIHKNKASNLKSALMKRVHILATTTPVVDAPKKKAVAKKAPAKKSTSKKK
jgi:small subunit ribosomal protein S20